MSERVPETGRTDRIPPYSEEAERGVLGSIILAPEKVLGAVVKRGVSAESFYVPAHRILFAQMREMADAGKMIDLLTLPQWCKARGLLEQVGGDPAIEAMVDGTPHDGRNAEAYAEIVQDMFMRRCLIDRARETIEGCFYGEDDTKSLVSRAMAGIQGLADGVFTETRKNGDVLNDLLTNWQRAYDVKQRGEDYLPGLRTPFRRFNEITGGLQPGLFFFGGKSSAGKTSLIINICRGLLEQQLPGLIIQLDDTHDDMIGRLVSMMSGVSLPALGQGFAKGQQLDKIRRDVKPFIDAMPLHVVEECADVREAAALARYHKSRFGIRWMVIDYVQVLDADGNPRDDERIRLGKIAAACKRLWKELRIPVLVVSQVSKFKDAEDDGRKADMSDLFGASELFHAATGVFIAKNVKQKAGKGEPLVPIELPLDHTGWTKKLAVALHVAKNKHGPKDCHVKFWALLKYFRFEETPFAGEGSNARQVDWEDMVNHQARMMAERGGDFPARQEED